METLGSLIDKLSIVNIKIFKQEDIKRDINATDKVIANATKLTNKLNAYRNELISEIDEQFGGATGNNIKMYGR